MALDGCFFEKLRYPAADGKNSQRHAPLLIARTLLVLDHNDQADNKIAKTTRTLAVGFAAGLAWLKVIVHYFRANANLLGGETHVNVTITRHAGSPKEKVERRTVILRREGEQANVTTISF